MVTVNCPFKRIQSRLGVGPLSMLRVGERLDYINRGVNTHCGRHHSMAGGGDCEHGERELSSSSSSSRNSSSSSRNSSSHSHFHFLTEDMM
ncbi:hypothetical protein STEG23_000104 [Scotinomys teguina]